MKNVFIKGPIKAEFIAESIAKHSHKTNIGAHDIFLGQVRADKVEGKEVQQIDYSAFEEMANEAFYEIRERTFDKFDLSCMHIYHSLGAVKAGEISLFVFVSSKHRAMAFDACRDIVEDIKANVPIWKKEIYTDQSHIWVE
jgi:molybdopterin synthase catalytic subunit